MDRPANVSNSMGHNNAPSSLEGRAHPNIILNAPEALARSIPEPKLHATIQPAPDSVSPRATEGHTAAVHADITETE